jgi:hypothetical protein
MKHRKECRCASRIITAPVNLVASLTVQHAADNGPFSCTSVVIVPRNMRTVWREALTAQIAKHDELTPFWRSSGIPAGGAYIVKALYGGSVTIIDPSLWRCKITTDHVFEVTA